MTALGGASDVPGTRNRVDIENLTRVDEHNKKENDDNNIQIIISSNPNEQTTIEVTSAVASPQDENQGVNEMTPVDQSTSAAVSLQDENQGVNETTPVDQNVATKLFEEYSDRLAIARYDKECRTALHMLARKPSEEMYMKEDNNEGGAGLQLLKNLWSHVRKLENHFLHLITHPSVVIFDAVKSGNNGAVKYILYTNRQLLTIKDVRGQNVLHYAVLYRNRNIFYFILLMETRNLVLLAVDNDRNNVLHLAAHRNCQHEELSSLRPTTQMKRQLEWFKEVEKRVPPELRTMRNNQGKIPIDVFYDEHKKLSEEIKASAKGIAESGMLVATLVATVAFAAALTVPGDKTNVWFIVFILTNAVALFASSASILSFLSNFTSSRFADSKFATSLHPSLILGPTLLIISTVAMVIAFVAASFLIFDHTSKWVAYVVASMGFFPILLFLLFQFSRFDDFLWSRCYRLSKVQ
ncbi:Ankyrin repeat-containing protein [Spatholobus suberectus]|nr:Ankyrin repeat-containing protein [Spatholobus suberectus]